MKRQRLDSPEGARDIAQKMKKIVFPANVSKAGDCDLFFANIIKEKASSLWSAHEIEIAAMLAVSMALFNDERNLLIKEGRVIVNAAGNPVNNPRVNTSRDLWSEVIQGRRSLGLQDAAKGNPADRKKRNEVAQEIERGFDSKGDDLDQLLN